MSKEHEEELNLSGDTTQAREGSYSGARFSVVDNVIVKYSDNLRKSAELQKQFKSDIFRTPKVRNYSDRFISQEYLGSNVVNAAQYLTNTYDDVMALELWMYCQFIKNNIFQGTTNYAFTQAPFIKKILQIINRLNNVTDIRLAERVAVNLNAEGYTLPAGMCHGDFTFSNILYPGRYLIDFTPAYINSPLLDVVKLKQEYKLLWSAYVCKLDVNKYKSLLTELEENVQHFFGHYDTRMLEALNLLRILPYAKSEAVTNLLRREIKLLIE